jgi:hypothetical protein
MPAQPEGARIAADLATLAKVLGTRAEELAALAHRHHDLFRRLFPVLVAALGAENELSQAVGRELREHR